MWRKLLVSSMLLLCGVGAHAQTVTTTAPVTTVTTTTPGSAPQQVIVSPTPQSASCKTVAAHWKGNTWVAEQTVCTYSNRAEGVAWVNDYWTCTKYDLNTGNCDNWAYQPGYWVQTLP